MSTTSDGRGVPHRFWRGVARLCRFDLRRFRVALAIVAGLELLRAVMTEWALHHGALLGGVAYGAASDAFEVQALDGALWLATVITTAMLVQADHPEDDRGFLRSRPIGTWSLAFAKLLFLGALAVGLPFAATAARLLAYGAPATAIAASAMQFVVIGGAIAIPSWALALATRTLPRFLAAAAGVTVAWYVVTAIIVSLALDPFKNGLAARIYERRLWDGFAPPLADWQRVDDRGWLFALAMTLVAAAILVSHYRTRRGMTSAIAAVTLIAAPALIPATPASLAAAPDLVHAASGGLRLEAVEIHGADVIGALVLPALPSNVGSRWQLRRVHFTGPGIDLWGVGWPFRNPGMARASAAARGSAAPASTYEPELMLVQLTPADSAALRGRHVNVDAPVQLRFTRHVRVADLPVRPGTAFRTDAYLIEVLSVDLDSPIWAACRFTRFPSLGRLHPTLIPSLDPTAPDEHHVGWARGRTWTRVVRLRITAAAGPIPPRLRIVESRPAGEMPTVLTGRDVPVRPSDPRRPSLLESALSGAK